MADARNRMAALLERQSDVARRDQLSTVGVTWAELDANLAAHRWQTAGPLVVVVHNGPLTPLQELWTAVLHCGPDAALAARTAAAAGGLVGWEAEGIEVVVRRGARIAELPGVHLIVHESRRFGRTDVHPTLLPPRTRFERSLIDAAAWSPTDRAACGILCAGVQQRLTTATRLREALLSAGRIQRRSLLDATLCDVEGGAQALSEIDFNRLCRRWNLPVVVHQVVRRDRRGRRRYVDAVLRGPNGRVVRVEVDGAMHLLVRTYWDDMFRQNEFTISGEPILRYSSVAVRIDEATVVNQLSRALGLPSPLHAVANPLVRTRPGRDLVSF